MDRDQETRTAVGCGASQITFE